MGGNVAQRIGKLCYVKISASTILRLVIKCPIPIIELPKIIGVGDWAFKKRLKYGTIIVDLEKNEVINLLPDREGNGRRSACRPLVYFENLTEDFKGFLNTQRKSLKDISAELSEEQQLVVESTVPEIIEIAKKRVIFLNFEDYLIKRWQRSEQQVKVLFEEIKGQGFKYFSRIHSYYK